MNSKKLSFLLLGVIGVICLAIVGGAYEVNNLLQSRSEKLVDLKLQTSTLDQKQLQLLQDKKDIQTYQSLNTIAKTIVPQDKNQAQALLQIVSLARASGIPELSSISFPESNLGGSSAATGSAGGANSNANSSLNKLTQLIKVPGVSGVYDLQITVQQSSTNAVSYNQFLTFLSRLQQNRRTAQVSSVSVQPDSKNPGMVSFTLVIDEFIKP